MYFYIASSKGKSDMGYSPLWIQLILQNRASHILQVQVRAILFSAYYSADSASYSAKGDYHAPAKPKATFWDSSLPQWDNHQNEGCRLCS